MSNTPIGRIKFKFENVNYSVVTIWQSDKGLSISLDKHTEQYPAMNPIRVFKEWAAGRGFLNYFPASSRGQSSGGGGSSASNAAPPQDDFLDSDVPF